MKRRILLVDDELAILLTLKAVLEMNDFEVETASSAREARSKLRASTFHMVITDMRMENESAGLEVVRTAKQVSYQPAVAMLTAVRRMGAASTELVRYATSGDVSGDRERVVGYAGILVR